MTFEEFITAPSFGLRTTKHGYDSACPGAYVDYKVELAWEAWKFARREYEWRPMETAPRDGTEILVYHEPFDESVILVWSGFWVDSGCIAECEDIYPESHLTAWMPVPKPEVTKLRGKYEVTIRNKNGRKEQAFIVAACMEDAEDRAVRMMLDAGVKTTDFYIERVSQAD